VSRFVALAMAGLSTGAVYALVASGIVLVHKATGAVNFAQGDLLTLGAYVYLWLTDESIPVWPAAILAMVILFGVGGAIERVVFVPLRNKPRLTVAVATFGIAIGIEAALTVWKGSNPIVVPSLFGSGSVSFLGANVPVLSLWTIAITIVVFLALNLLFQRTQMGRMVRALASDQEVAVMYGVPTSALNFLTFGLSGALAALGGVLFAPAFSLTPQLGFAIILFVFAAVTIGGFDRLETVALAAFIIGLAQQLLSGYVSAAYSEAYPYIIMLVILLIRPTGLARGAVEERY